MTLQQLRKELYILFKAKNIESPEVDSGLIIMHVLKLSKTALLLDNSEVSDSAAAEIIKLAHRRADGEPVRYIIGTCPFMQLEFYVNKSTLIPRQDTEILVETVSDMIDSNKDTVLWDIGCGSGCIGITLAYMHTRLSVYEFDISETALETAAKTAKRYSLDNRISFVKHDILSGMPRLDKPQIIVSNPPYIPTGSLDSLQREVIGYEPVTALDGGEDGLKFYKKIIHDAPLGKGGLLAFEIGYDQGESVPRIMENNGYKNIRLIRDLSGNPRVVLGYKKQ